MALTGVTGFGGLFCDWLFNALVGGSVFGGVAGCALLDVVVLVTEFVMVDCWAVTVVVAPSAACLGV